MEPRRISAPWRADGLYHGLGEPHRPARSLAHSPRGGRPCYHLITEMRTFDVEPDARARSWLESHPSPDPWVIAYDVHRCCGGGKICTVAVRHKSQDDKLTYAPGNSAGGPEFLIDSRA